MNLPIFVDKNTMQPFIDPTIPWDRDLFPEDQGASLAPRIWMALTLWHRTEAKNGAALPNHIYMDSMGFGMGCCCLQVTFQACSIHEARAIYVRRHR